MLLSIGDRVREGMYSVHSRFDHAVNFVARGRLVSIVSDAVGPGPANIVVRGSARRFCGEADRLRIRRGSITLTPRSHATRRIAVYRSGLGPDPMSSSRFARNFQSLEKWVPRFSNPWNFLQLLVPHPAPALDALSRAFARRIRAGAKDVLAGLDDLPRLRRGAKRLAGCGFGLTPGGDDFLAGAMLALHLAARLTGKDYRSAIATIHAASKTKHKLSAHFLGLARDGFVAEQMKNLITALLGGTARDVRSAARRVLALGETSGADLTAGFVLMMRTAGRDERLARPRTGQRPVPTKNNEAYSRLPAGLTGRRQNSGSRGVNPRGASKTKAWT